MPNEYRIVETPGFAEKIQIPEYRKMYQKAREYVYPQLKANPFFGPNIKKLKGEFSGIYRYRVGDFRLFYTIKEDRVMVVVIDVDRRKDAYR